jgi:hypothetical protein
MRLGHLGHHRARRSRATSERKRRGPPYIVSRLAPASRGVNQARQTRAPPRSRVHSGDRTRISIRSTTSRRHLRRTPIVAEWVQPGTPATVAPQCTRSNETSHRSGFGRQQVLEHNVGDRRSNEGSPSSARSVTAARSVVISMAQPMSQQYPWIRSRNK